MIRVAMEVVLLITVATLLARTSLAQSLEPYAHKVGSAFCMYLAYKGILPRKYFNKCGPPTCAWDDWKDALANTNVPNQKIVLSYSHNGFGNQLWEHSVAFMVAESLKARLLVAIIPDNLSPNGYIPPNTWSGMSAMERLLPKEFLYESLPANSSIRTLCENEPFFASDRPYDWRNKNYSENFRHQLHSILSDPKPRCLKLVGYFQNLPLCQEDARQLWMNRMLANFTVRPGDNDISIYLRCIPRHYHFNDANYYESILNNTQFDRVWLFQAPECPNKLSNNPSKDNLVTSVVRLLREKFNATRWPSYEGPDDTVALLHDLAGLAMSKKLILPLSSWAFWAGMLSNATEIHVNAPPFHPLMPHYSQYIYHDERNRMFFGKYNATENDIIYAIKPSPTSAPTSAPVSHHSSQPHHTHDHHHSFVYTSAVAIHRIGVNVTLSVEILSAGKAVIESYSQFNSSDVEGFQFNVSNLVVAINRTHVQQQLHRLVYEGSVPAFAKSSLFDLKASVTVAVAKDISILMESFTIKQDSADLRETSLEKTVESPKVAVNTAIVKEVAMALMMSSLI